VWGGGLVSAPVSLHLYLSQRSGSEFIPLVACVCARSLSLPLHPCSACCLYILHAEQRMYTRHPCSACIHPCSACLCPYDPACCLCPSSLFGVATRPCHTLSLLSPALARPSPFCVSVSLCLCRCLPLCLCPSPAPRLPFAGPCPCLVRVFVRTGANIKVCLQVSRDVQVPRLLLLLL
jgi:hypothetical protein